MDDVTLGGHISDVSMAIEIINREGSSIGLKLNPTKCEVVGEVPIALPVVHGRFYTAQKIPVPTSGGVAFARRIDGCNTRSTMR